MRIPSPSPPPRSMRATKPSGTYVAGGTTGPQGTPGGKARKPGAAGRKTRLGNEVYLWILVLIEAWMTGLLRRYFRRFHGG